MTDVPISVPQLWQFEGGPWDGVVILVQSSRYGPEVLLVGTDSGPDVHYWLDNVPEHQQEPKHYLYRTYERVRAIRG
jgi:hypothetical protein